MFNKKEKIYKFDRTGLAEVKYDIKKEKQSKMDSIISVLLLLVFFSFGALSKEYMLFVLAGKGVNFITKIFL